MDLTIIIVNWNVRDLVVKCLETIFRYTEGLQYEVIVVDNASNDNSIQEIRRVFVENIRSQKLLVIENRTNAGFSKANNQGFKEARGRYILFMNPDMEFVENTPLKLKSFMDTNPQIGMATCTLMYGDGTIQRNIKSNPTLCSQLFILLKLHHVFPNALCLNTYLSKEFDYSTSAEVEQIMGAFVFTRNDLMRDLQAWDEDYWLWWEDVDLCKRVQDVGRKIMYTPVSKVIHFEGKSFEQVISVTKQKRFINATLVYFRKHRPQWERIILHVISPISIVLAFITQTLKIKPKPQSRI